MVLEIPTSRRNVLKAAVGTASMAAVPAGLLSAGVVAATHALAQDGKEPLGGQPPQGSTSSVTDFDYQIKHQRAFEAVLWNMPAISIYSFRRAAFNAFIYMDLERTTLSSYDLGTMKKNADGGVTIYVGPKAPDALDANWIPTAGKRPLPAMRFYGPTEAFNDKRFKLPDFELAG